MLFFGMYCMNFNLDVERQLQALQKELLIFKEAGGKVPARRTEINTRQT